MVGVPGRSGGCATCRRRKKGCDKKTPFCGQCVQAGLVCEGYSRHHSVWINSTDGENRKYSKTVTSNSPSIRAKSGSPTSHLNESLARSAREDQYVGLYLAAFLPNGRVFSRHASQISSAGWLRFHEGLCRSEKTLRYITLAHGLSMLATRDNDIQMKVKGFQAQQMALQEMRRAVQDPQRATGDGLFAAVRLFRFYDILYGAEVNGQSTNNSSSQVKGYYAHTEGEMAMFMNRGPDRKWSEAGKYLLAAGRIVSFILGVGRRKSSPFSNHRWLTVPWEDAKKTPLEELIDIMVQVPGLLEELDSIRASDVTERSPDVWNDLLDKCSHLEEELLAWRVCMRDDLWTYDYTHSGNPPPSPQVDRDFAVLHLSFFYWCCSILLYTTIHMAMSEAGPDQISTLCSPIPFYSSNDPNYQDERNPTLHAHRIIHALPLSYLSHGGGYAALSSTFPLGIALRYLMVADIFPHETDSVSQKDFLEGMLSQPFMKAYGARFVNNLHKQDSPVQSLKETTGWQGEELRARIWWFGPAVTNDMGSI